MNRHSRIIVILLLIILAALSAAIVLFRIDVGKDAGDAGKGSSAYVQYDDSSSAIVFKDGSGLYGLKDRDGNIILEPEWSELTVLGSGSFRARLNTRSETMYGVIDRKGDITVPFMYDEINRISDYLYSAKLHDTGKYHFYGNDFSLLINGAADSFFLEGTSILISQGQDTFTFKQGENLSLVRAELPRFKRPVDLKIKVEDPEVLSAMDCMQWSRFADDAVAFIDALRRNNIKFLCDESEKNAFYDIISEIKEIDSWKGRLSDNTFVYMINSEGEDSVYLETELTLPTENENDTEQNIPLRIQFKENETTGEWLIIKAAVN